LQAQEVYEALQLGFELFVDVGQAHGYSSLFTKYPSFKDLYAAYLEKTRPHGPVSWSEIHQFVLSERSDVDVLQSSASSMDVVKQRYAQELGPLFAACSALATCVLGHEGGASAASGSDLAAVAVKTATNSVGVDASVQTHVARRQAQAVVAAQNFGRRKQTRDMLQRYQHLPTQRSACIHS
jgi:hypothetical protein